MSWCPPAAFAIGFATFVAHTALGVYSGERIGIQNNDAVIISAWFCGPIYPLVEAFGQIPQLKGEVLEKQNDFEAVLKESITFFNHNHSELEDKLIKDIEQLKASLAHLQLIAQNTPKAERAMHHKLQVQQRALSELQNAKAFYAQFPTAA